MSNFSVLVTTPPYDSSAGTAAVSFIKNAVSQGHSVDHVFFYQQGVYHANRFISSPADELNVHKEWISLHQKHNFRLLVCITAALKRGVTDTDHALDSGQSGHNLTAPFEQAGLGEFFSALHSCDHLVQF